MLIAIRGKVVIQNSELDDLIIKRTDGSPTYNFTVVIDDWDMGITEVIRGEDHINNTPRQVNIFRALKVKRAYVCAFTKYFNDQRKKIIQT